MSEARAARAVRASFPFCRSIMTDAYQVPDLPPGTFHRAEETVRRSRFIVTMAHVTSPEEAKAFIETVRA